MPDPSEAQRRRYNRLAPRYEKLLARGFFGRMEAIHRATADALGELPGGSVVELGCGPGNVSGFLLAKIGETGTLVGVDLSDAMIERARARAQAAGWRNARYVRTDMLRFAPEAPVDAVVFALSLTLMPDPTACLEHALAMLRTGGRLVVLDSIPDPSHRLANWAIRLKAPLVGAKPTPAPMDFARGRLEDLRIEHHLGGTYTVVSGQKPGEAAASG